VMTAKKANKVVFNIAVSVIAVVGSFKVASAAPEDDPWGGVRNFDAEISAANQTTFTKSDGRGTARLSFDIETLEMTWEIEYADLTSPPVGIHLHGPAQPGTNAVEIVDLGVNGLRSPIKGTVTIPDAYAQYMLLGWSYVLLKTEKYPDGELRGKVDVVPPPDYLEKSRAWGRGEIE
jgi:hypothetical protein